MAWRRLCRIWFGVETNTGPVLRRPILFWLALLTASVSIPAFLPGPAAAGLDSDTAPQVTAVFPPPDAVDIPLDASLTIQFSEPVALPPSAVELQCEGSGAHTLAIQGDGMAFDLRPDASLWPNERCVATVLAEKVTDLDDDPPEAMTADYTWSFTTGAGLARQVIINELDAITAEGRGEFIELYDGGAGGTDLDGLVVVLYRGSDDTVYLALDLDGYATDSAGYFVLGTRDLAAAGLIIANGLLRDGPDAVALYAGDAAGFPEGAAVATGNLLDAVVYAGAEPPGASLLALLEAGGPPADETGRGQAGADSTGRCPNGAGGQRWTTGFVALTPSPGAPNACVQDKPPQVVATSPRDGDTDVDPAAAVGLTFSEAVVLEAGALGIECPISGGHETTVTGDGTAYTFAPATPFAPGERCVATVFGQRVRDADDQDPPDLMAADYTWAFTIRRPVADFLLINEVDADTPGSDAAEFIELYDGGIGGTALDGLALVLFDGDTDQSYRAIDLDGYATDGAGYFVVGGSGVAGAGVTLPDGWLQNGPDAVGLFAANARAFPVGTPLPGIAPLDALVYGPGDEPDGDLLAMLNPGQPQVDEYGRDNGETHANQRCPNGGGGPRDTIGYRQNRPTPGDVNDCLTDTAPQVVQVSPPDGAAGVKVDAELIVAFDEAVSLSDGWLDIVCAASGSHAYTVVVEQAGLTIRSELPFAKGERCVATIFAEKASDEDADDPPDIMTADYTWSFTTEEPVADFIVINEVDADTPGSDAAEFIELYDGGIGGTALDGLALVFFNGDSLAAYRSIDLSGVASDARGYVVVGNPALQPDIEFPDGSLQNGPDAVALVAGQAAAFPGGAPLPAEGVVDAIVYGDPVTTPAALLELLQPGQGAANETGRGAGDDHSLQRCPNGAGDQRRTASFIANRPTPRAPSDCVTDTAPLVLATNPINAARGVARFSDLAVNFSEPVVLSSDWLQLTCSGSGAHRVITSGGPATFTVQVEEPFAPGEACEARVTAAAVIDADSDDPPDRMAADHEWRFEVAAAVADFVLINEVDADTSGSDTAEFIELYDGGAGGTDLSGLVLVLFNGYDDRSYQTIDLQGQRTDAGGYFVIGNSDVGGRQLALPDGTLQNGADAVALFEREAIALPDGSPVSIWGLADALVYSTSDPADAALLTLLNPGQPQADENGRGGGAVHSLQRCPNGAGGRRNTTPFLPNQPTAGHANHCAIDAAPDIESVEPPPGAAGVTIEPEPAITLDEAVAVDTGWVSFSCSRSGRHDPAWSGGPRAFRLALAVPLARGETCTVRIVAGRVHDLDDDDPPDTMAADYTWQFTTATAPVADFVLINEIDADTEGSDSAEFIELYDGGRGDTDLSGLVLVFWNGRDDRSYRALALDGFRTDGNGYFVAGNSGVAKAALIFGNGGLQNGPDAVGLYKGRAADFPNGSLLATGNLLDALVYGPDDEQDAELARLLNPGQAQVDENTRGAVDTYSLQRCPDGNGGQRNTAAFRPSPPTPGGANGCVEDQAPAVLSVRPANEAMDVPLTVEMQVTFSEPVSLSSGWISLDCDASGRHDLATSGGERYFSLRPGGSFISGENCRARIDAAKVHDLDRDDPPDTMAADYTWQFTTEAAPVADFVLINEIDADTEGSDTAEFIELYDGGRGNTSLAGLILVFGNGRDDEAYRALDLSGYWTDAAGYFVAGNSGLVASELKFDNGTLQNGPDAIALYKGRAADFPDGTSLALDDLIDAVVYGPGDDIDKGLLALLNPGQPQANENGRGSGTTHSLQRCPNGTGGQRNTAAYRPNLPTPGAANVCIEDDPPVVASVTPPDGATDVPLTVSLAVEFDEAVDVEAGWIRLTCAKSGDHALTTGGDNSRFILAPIGEFTPGEGCQARIDAAKVHDLDGDDPPDGMVADYSWQFTTVAAPVADFVLINEVDADTEGSDSAEFIELYDGGRGDTDLSGLVLVFWNGRDDRSYRALALEGYRTDGNGYFVAGNSGVAKAALIFGNGGLQNGPDAVGLYKGRAADFPNGSSLETGNLLDAFVYGPGDDPDAGLLALLEPDRPQADENGRGAAQSDSLGRCPNGEGGRRDTNAYRPGPPTPGAANPCIADDPPFVDAVFPADGSTDLPVDGTLEVTFSEDVAVSGGWLALDCDAGGAHDLRITGGPRVFTAVPSPVLAHGDTCRATVTAARVSDLDGDDPPDHMAADFAWKFTTSAAPPPDIRAAFSHNGPLWIGQPAVFTNASAGPQPLAFRWDFGDGSPPSTEIHPRHSYDRPGRYLVTLTASYGGNRDTAEAVVEVRPRLVFLPVFGSTRPVGALYLPLVAGR